MKNTQKLFLLELFKLRSLGKTLWLNVALTIAFMLFTSLSAAGYILFVYLWVYSPAAYDEVNKGEYLLCTLPVTRREIVFSRYLYSFCGVLIAAAAGRLLAVLGSTLSGKRLDIGNIGDGSISVWVLLWIGSIFVSIVLPLIFHFGITKARALVMVVYIGGIGLASGMIVAFRAIGWTIDFADSFLLLLSGVVVLVFSFFLSLRLFEKRQIS